MEVPGAHLKQSTITELLCVERDVCLEKKEKGEAKLGCSLLQETFPHDPQILRKFFQAHQIHHVLMSVEPVKRGLWGHAISYKIGTTDVTKLPLSVELARTTTSTWDLGRPWEWGRHLGQVGELENLWMSPGPQRGSSASTSRALLVMSPASGQDPFMHPKHMTLLWPL